MMFYASGLTIEIINQGSFFRPVQQQDKLELLLGFPGILLTILYNLLIEIFCLFA
jgi:hypothetical protein